MIDVAFTSLHSCQENSCTSDASLDQMEQQTFAPTTAHWTDILKSYWHNVLSALGNLIGLLQKPTKAPVLVDAASQTEDDCFSELTENGNWNYCPLNSKSDTDDESQSCNTEATDLSTDASNFDDDRNDESDGDNSSLGDELFRAYCGASEAHSNCSCKINVEQLQLLNVKRIEHEKTPSSIYVQDYLCSCGQCPQYKEITQDVEVTVAECKFMQRPSVIRLLQAFSTYNEVVGYRTDMISAACNCFRVWCGDEDKAFECFVTLYDE